MSDMNTEETNFAEQARLSIRWAMAEMNLKPKSLFVLLYGREPEGNEEQTFRNRLNRGSPGADFIGLCVSKMPPLQSLPLADFFSISQA